jgi:hypothetical protein
MDGQSLIAFERPIFSILTGYFLMVGDIILRICNNYGNFKYFPRDSTEIERFIGSSEQLLALMPQLET